MPEKSDWMPTVPKITRACGQDGRVRVYIIAANAVDIDAMCRAAGLPVEGIREGKWYDGWERIVKDHEYARLKRVFS